MYLPNGCLYILSTTPILTLTLTNSVTDLFYHTDHDPDHNQNQDLHSHPDFYTHPFPPVRGTHLVLLALNPASHLSIRPRTKPTARNQARNISEDSRVERVSQQQMVPNLTAQ